MRAVLGQFMSRWLLITIIISPVECRTGRAKPVSSLSNHDGITTKDYERSAAAQFMAEPDDLESFDKDSLLEIQRGMIKEYDDAKQNMPPNAFRYINDDQSLTDIQKNIFRKFNQSPSNNVPDGIRYINEAAAEMAMEGMLMDKLNKMIYINGMERSQIKSINKKESSNKHEYFDGKTRRNERIKNLDVNNENLNKGQISNNRPFGVSVSHEQSKDKDSNKRNKRYEKNKSKINANKIRAGPALKTSLNSRSKQTYRNAIASYKQIKTFRKKYGTSASSKRSYIESPVDLTKKIPVQDKGIHKKAESMVKRDIYRSANEPTNENDDERIKKGSIFTDIATAFKHIQQDQETKYKTKKSNLEEATKKPINGGFTMWTDWSDCSETCGPNAIRMRMRVCTNPPPSNGGQDCKGWRFEVKYCKIPKCQGFNDSAVNNSSNNKQNITSIHHALHTGQVHPSIKLTENEEERTNQSDLPLPQKLQANLEHKVEDNAKLKKDIKTNQQQPDNNIKVEKKPNDKMTTNREIEKIFNEAVHEAFDTNKKDKHEEEASQQTEQAHQKIERQYDQQKEKLSERIQKGANSTGDDQKSFPPLTIHTDSGLILSENEIDTIDDAPDTSQQDNYTNNAQSNETSTSTSEDTTAKDDAPSISNQKEGYINNFSVQTASTAKQNGNTSDYDLEKVAGELLKMNDSYSVLKALATVKSGDDIASYSDTAIPPNHMSENQDLNSNDKQNDSTGSRHTMNVNGGKAKDSKKTGQNDGDYTLGNAESYTSEPDIKHSVLTSSNEAVEINLDNANALSEVSSAHKASLSTNESITNNDKTINTAKFDNRSDSNKSENELQLVDHDEEELDDNSKSLASGEEKQANVESENKNQEVELKSSKNSHLDNVFVSGSGESENENKRKIAIDQSLQDFDWGNVHALNALVEILAAHEKNESSRYTKNTMKTNKMISDAQHDRKVNSSKWSEMGNENVGNFLKALSNETKTDLKTENGEAIAGYVNKLSSNNTYKNPKNKNEEDEDGTSDEDDVKELYNTGLNMLKNYDNEEKRYNVSEITGTKLHINEPSLTEVTDDELKITSPPSESKHSPVKSPSSNASLMVRINNSLKQNSSQSRTHPKPGRSLFEVLKEVVSTFSKFSNAMNTNNSDASNANNVKNNSEEVKIDSAGNSTQTDIHSGDEETNLTPWTPWSKCSQTCGLGFKTRMRRCLSEDKPCEGLLKQNQSCHLTNCPADGEFTEWSLWSSCSTTCGVKSYKIRNRTCANSVARFGGKQCHDALEEKIKCDVKPCVDFVIAGTIGGKTLLPNHEQPKKEKGFWGPWSAWTKCSRSCGGDGFAKRERWCLPGKNCTGPRYDTKECGMQKCPVDGGFSTWTKWSTCTPSCGERAYKIRYRNCTSPIPQYGGKKCFGDSLETEPCAIVKCPIDGRFSSWSAWSLCSKTCNTSALKQRERTCSNPSPRYGGRPCVGILTESKECGVQPCPINGKVTQWSAWTKCPNLTCGSSFNQSRTRKCENPKPQFGGRDCTETLFEGRRCEPPTCPVDGGFSEWTAWSVCPKKCQSAASSNRRRICNSPEPKYGGKPCEGQSSEFRPCQETKCKVDGGFTEWSAWSSCSKECGHTSIRSRERYCTNPTPLNGGKPCKGNKFQISVCKTDGCPRNGNFTEWSGWTECPKCGKGMRSRVRTCTNPPPINGGKDCKGAGKQTIACPYKKCKDNGFGQWSSYGLCSKSCGGGAKMRRRSCENEKKGCDGKYVQLKLCNIHSCVLGTNNLYHPTPTSMCGFNPCKIARCLNRPDAMCVTSSKCDPVFFDKRGNIINSCKGDYAILTESPEKRCGNDPCQTSGCYTDEASRCYVTLRCAPLFVDDNGEKLQCRGLLKVPPSSVCGADPCENGRSCDLDPSARCIADYKCRPVFISEQNEILDECSGDDKEESKETKKLNKKKLKARELKMILQTTEDIKNMKKQLNDLLKTNSESSNVDTYEDLSHYQTNIDDQEAERLSPKQRNTLEYRLQQFKKRNRFYKPKKHPH